MLSKNFQFKEQVKKGRKKRKIYNKGIDLGILEPK